MSILSFAVVALLGCREQPQIRTYSVPKASDVLAENHVEGAGGEVAPVDSANPGEPSHRMLAAIVPHGEQAWFFKLTGPIDSVEPIAEPFKAFIKTVRFDEKEAGEPIWDKPEEWEAKPASEMRFATLVIPSATGPLELAVSSLGYTPEDNDGFLLANINRWRKQMSLPEVSLLAMPKQVEEIELSGAKATLVDLTGRFGAGGMRPPFASGAGGNPALPENHPPINSAPPGSTPPSATAPNSATASELQFQAPEGWQPQPTSVFRKAAFAVEEGDEKVEITIISAGGNLLDNINRWRGQVSLEPIDEEQLEKDGQPIEGEGWQGKYFVLVGPESAENRQTILGVMTNVGERSWFIKLSGSAELADRERENFETFARSVHF